MATSELQEAASQGASTPQSDAAPTRLVIRVKIIREAPPEPATPAHLSKRTLALGLGLAVIAMLTLIWIVASVSNGASSFAPDESVATLDVQLPSPAISPAPSEDTLAPEPLVAAEDEPPDSPPSPISEVMPDVPQSALDTIRGTVRVAIRATLDQSGLVTEATSEIPGPSRYFERISRETAKQWTFTPGKTQEEREMLIRFFYTRDGTRAQAETIATSE